MDPSSLASAPDATPPEIAAPIQESFLQGSLMDSHKDFLITRLRGICDLRDKPFVDHEMTFIHTLTTSGGGPGGATSQPPLRCRLRRSLNPQAPGFSPSGQQEAGSDPYQLRYLGSAEPDRHVMRRVTMEIPVSSNATIFLHDLGFQLEFECVLDGVMFGRGAIKVLVYTVNSVRSRSSDGTPISWTRLNERSNLVELSVLASPGDDMVADELLALADQLKPLVTVAKIDQRKLVNKG